MLFKCKILGQLSCFFSRGHSAMKSGHPPTIVPKSTVEWSEVKWSFPPSQAYQCEAPRAGLQWSVVVNTQLFRVCLMLSLHPHCLLDLYVYVYVQVCVAKWSILGKLRSYYKLLKISVVWPSHPLLKNWWFQRENTMEIQPSFLLQDNAESQIALLSTFSAP